MCDESKKSGLSLQEAARLKLAVISGATGIPSDLLAEAESVMSCEAAAIVKKHRPPPLAVEGVALGPIHQGGRDVAIMFSTGVELRTRPITPSAAAVLADTIGAGILALKSQRALLEMANAAREEIEKLT